MLSEWIWLQEIVKGISMKRKKTLVRYFADPAEIFRADFHDLQPFGVTRDTYDLYFQERALDQANTILEVHNRLGISQINQDDQQFKDCDWLVLFYKGKLSSGPSATVMGNRYCSEHGRFYTQKICDELISDGLTVNSGLGDGIEHAALQSSLRSGGTVQAFLAHGLDICYPDAHKPDLVSVLELGAAITPFVAGTRPFRHRFAMRNALMIDWSDTVVVAEADSESGVIGVAVEAIKKGKDVMTIATQSVSKSCSGNQILLDLGAKKFCFKADSDFHDPAPVGEIINMLRDSPRSTDELANAADKPFGEIADYLLQHSLDNWVVFSGDGKWHYNGW